MGSALDALLANPHDDELRRVVADELQRAGDPRGELAIVQDRRQENRAAGELAAREAALIAEVAPELAPIARFDLAWHLGWIRAARFELANWGEGDAALPAVAARVRALVESPSARLLDCLQLMITPAWSRTASLAPLVEAAQHEFLEALRTLEIGGVMTERASGRRHSERDISPTELGDVGTLIAQCPRVEVVRLQGNGAELGAALSAPALRELEVCASDLGIRRLEALVHATLPALERLELWFGDCEYGELDPCAAADVERLLLALQERSPRLTHLGLVNHPATDDVVDILRRPSLRELGSRLRGLDVSHGTLGGGGARSLSALRRHLPSLEELTVTWSYLSPANVAKLTEAYAGVRVVSGEQHRARSDGEVQRYVSLGE